MSKTTERTAIDVLPICQHCHGTGVIIVKYGTVYETETPEEVALTYHDEPCPECTVSSCR